MPNLMIIPQNNQINKLIKYSDAFLFGIGGMSINMPLYFTLEEIKKLNHIIKENDKEIFISLNKNMHNQDLKRLEEVLICLNDLQVDGLFYYDVAVLNIVKRLHLDLPLVWSAEHLTTNYATINFWKDMGADYTYLSAEITLEEIIEIRKHTNSKLIVPMFGYLPIFASMRHTVKNYLQQFNLSDHSKINYINLKNDNYPIVDDHLGTNIYSAHILNGYKEYLNLENDKVDYITLNAFNIEEAKFLEIVKMFREKKEENEEKINTILNNTDKGFLYKETIYKVKKND